MGASVPLGASVIEKNITLDRVSGGPDDRFSLEPVEFAALCESARTAWEALGSVDYGRKSSEQGNMKFRRSLYFVKDTMAGEVADKGSVRPGFGIAPKKFDKLIGRRLLKSVKAGSSVQWEYLE